MINVLELIDGGFMGGGQTHILSLVRCLDKERFLPVIAASGKGGFKIMVNENGYTFEDIELPKLYRSKHLKILDKIIRENSINIIHSHGGVAGMYARFYKKKYNKVRVVHTIHGIHYLNSPNFLRKYSSVAMEQFLVNYTDKFICVSDSDFKTASENRIINPEITVVIKNGIDLARFPVKSKDKILMEKLGIEESDFIIGNIARFDIQKNQKYIILNSAELLRKYPHVKILLIGDGKLLNECKLLAGGWANRIIFIEEVNDPECYYSLFDIFIFPSMWEGLSISLIEAMASGCCILASDITANLELINNSNGVIFSLDDKKEYARKIEILINDKNMRNNLSAKAHIDSANYSDEVMTKRIEEQYL